MTTRNLLASLLTLWATASLNVRAATLFVSPSGSDQPPYDDWTNAAHNIQTAVNAASDGDEVLVGDATYTVSSQVSISKAVRVKSLNGSTSCIINGSGNTRCVYLNDPNAVLEGFTITNGHFTVVGAPGENSNSFGGNGGSASAEGGGVYIDQYGELLNCVIFGNYVEARGGNGGRSYNDFPHGRGGDAAAIGGGVYVKINAFIDRCVFLGNRATASGGYGGNFDGASPIGQGGTAGSAAAYGAALHIASTATVRNCTFYNNSSSSTGGIGGRGWSIGGSGGNGISYGTVSAATNALIENCTIVLNSVSGVGGSGGGVNTGNPSGQPGGNGTSSSYGGGIYGGTGVTVDNTIAYSNSATNGANQYGTGAVYLNCCTVPLPGISQSCTTSDPVIASYQNRDFHLRRTSPCLDAGTNLPWMSSSHDIDGNPRLFGRAVDIGADEACWGPKALTTDAFGTGLITWNTIPDDQYRFERSTNLRTRSWAAWGQAVTATTERVVSEDDLSSVPVFFRIFSTFYSELTNGLVAYYPLDGNAGDESGNGHAGVVSGTLTSAVNRFGEAAKACYFDGSAYIDTGIALELVGGAISVSLWTYLPEGGGTGAALFGHGGPTSSTKDNYEIHLNTPDSFTFIAMGGGGSYATSTNIAQGQWVHLVAVAQDSPTVHRLYVNGVPYDGGSEGTASTLANFYIGASNRGGPYRNYTGILDDVRIYNRALGTDEVMKLYKMPF